MRIICIAILLLLTTFLTDSANAQADVSSLGFAYTTLIRDNSGNPQPLATVQLRFTLINGMSGSITNAAWVETQTTKTDDYGFANVTIGAGTRAGGTAASFATIDFSQASYWLLAEVFTKASGGYDALEKKALQAVPYAKMAGSVADVFAPGTMISFGGDTSKIPGGWILCDGRELDNANPLYLPLFKAIGYAWGTSNGINKFNVPDTRGVFLRGANNGNGKDSGAIYRTPFTGGNAGDKVGTRQQHAFQAHEHNANAATISYTPGNFQVDPSNYNMFGIEAHPAEPETTTDPKFGGSANFLSETRPKNIYVNYIIKL